MTDLLHSEHYDVSKFIGIPYCLHNRFGVNCWAFIGLVFADKFHQTLRSFEIGNGTSQELAATFTSAFASGDHGFHKVESPKDFDVVVFNRNRAYHVGLWINGKVLHCSRHTAGGSYQDFETVKRGFKAVEFWRK